MSEIIYDPQIRINNETFGLVPNSLLVTPGGGEASNKPQTSGNGEVTMVYSENIETKYSIVKFSLYSTADSIDKILNLREQKQNNYISINAPEGNYIFINAALINNPEVTMGNDGQVELEFHAKPIK